MNYFGAVMVIDDSTISYNTGGRGGGIYNHSSPTFGSSSLTMNNSTISFNHATNDDIEDDAGGGEIYNLGHLTMTHSTIYSNTAAGIGDGIYSGVGIIINNTLIVANGDENCNLYNSGIDVSYSMTDNNDDCDMTESANINLDPLLSDNGGSTFAHALLAVMPSTLFR